MSSRALGQLVVLPSPAARRFASSGFRGVEVETDAEFAARDAAAVGGLGCVRGIRYALAIEGAAALSLYGLWLLWHLVR